jgi:hypothetical protein
MEMINEPQSDTIGGARVKERDGKRNGKGCFCGGK